MEPSTSNPRHTVTCVSGAGDRKLRGPSQGPDNPDHQHPGTPVPPPSRHTGEPTELEFKGLSLDIPAIVQHSAVSFFHITSFTIHHKWTDAFLELTQSSPQLPALVFQVESQTSHLRPLLANLKLYFWGLLCGSRLAPWSLSPPRSPERHADHSWGHEVSKTEQAALCSHAQQGRHSKGRGSPGHRAS